MSEIPEEPAALDSGGPASTLHAGDPPLLDVPAVQHLDGGDPLRSVSDHGGCESPCPDLDEDESPVDTDETALRMSMNCSLISSRVWGPSVT